MLGVASLNEALDLRNEGITSPILVLGYAPPWQAPTSRCPASVPQSFH